MDAPEPRQAPLRRSLSREPTILGGERAPMLIIIVASTLLTFAAMTLFSFVAGAFIFLAGYHGLRKASKLHPKATRVYREFIRYRRFYPARARYPNPRPYAAVCELGRRPPR